VLLRGFDQDMGERVGAYMEEHTGVRFLRQVVPTKVEKVCNAAVVSVWSTKS
jgi:pyruvate/2-oxoglutarate dehydrogenase complex dihydrolipoamide dehydrogenase (E3) component